jgi:inosine-uridine nucleoside N-ribohydrolase
MPPHPVVIDTDPGIDDLVALTLALCAPELRVVALVTSYGNATLDHTTRNLRALLAQLQRDAIPVFPGADRPLDRALAVEPSRHGPTGAGHAPVPPAMPIAADPGALIAALEHADEAITLVTLGPLTNLALALRTDVSLVRNRVQRHIGMFGSLTVHAGPDRHADSNAWSDPEATADVIAAGLPTTMVGLDVTRRIVLTRPEIATLARSEDPLTGWLAGALQFAVASHRRRGGLDGCRVHDVLPVAEAITPGLLTLAEHRLTVDLDEGDNRGRTVESGSGSPVVAAVDVDLTRTRALMRRVFPVLTANWPQ